MVRLPTALPVFYDIHLIWIVTNTPDASVLYMINDQSTLVSSTSIYSGKEISHEVIDLKPYGRPT